MLTSHLGDPLCKPLTVAQFRTLTMRVRGMEKPQEERQLTLKDLQALGYGEAFAAHILFLLSREEQLEHYVNRAKQYNCHPITRIHRVYPQILRERLGEDAPGCLWYKGDLAILGSRCISLVGSRDLQPDNMAFAREAGRQAALQGYVLVSGNARGADRTAQESCLAAGGQVVSIVADSLEKCSTDPNILYISEDSYETGFSAQRALSRNRLIHAMGALTLVVQSRLEKGGTWSGTAQNLRHSWSPVFCFQDGSNSAKALCQMGGHFVDIYDLADFHALQMPDITLF